MWLKDTYNFERKQFLIRLDFKICQKGRFKRLPEKKSEKTWFIVIQGFSFNITLYSSSLPVHVPFISDILYLKASWLISIQGCFFFLFCSFQLYNKPFLLVLTVHICKSIIKQCEYHNSYERTNHHHHNFWCMRNIRVD